MQSFKEKLFELKEKTEKMEALVVDIRRAAKEVKEIESQKLQDHLAEIDRKMIEYKNEIGSQINAINKEI